MNLKTTDTPNTPDSNEAELSTDTKENPIRVPIFFTASGDSFCTGGASLYKIIGQESDKKQKWKGVSDYAEIGYWNEGMMLSIIVGTIKLIVKRTPQGNLSRLEFDCMTHAKSIINGFNKQREVWETSDYINRHGNPVNNQEMWKELFALADTHSIVIRKPQAYSKVLNACLRRAKKAASEGFDRAWD